MIEGEASLSFEGEASLSLEAEGAEEPSEGKKEGELSEGGAEERADENWCSSLTRMDRITCFIATVVTIVCVGVVASMALRTLKKQETRAKPEQPMSSTHQVTTATSESSIVTSKAPTTTSEKPPEICNSPGCSKTAATILSYIDPDVNPCDDFYSFACGRWIKEKSLPNGKRVMNTTESLKKEINGAIRKYLEEKASMSEPDFIKKARDFFESCKDVTIIERASDKPLKSIINDLGGWPVVDGDKWESDPFDWLEMVIKFRQKGFNFNVFFEIKVEPDPMNSSRNVISIGKPMLGMGRADILTDKKKIATMPYYKFMVDSAVLLGANKRYAEGELQAALEFEIVLANYSSLKEKASAGDKKPFSELQKLAPQIPWRKYLNSLLMDQISDSEPVTVNVPAFIKNFGKLIDNTNKRVVANYMIWRVVQQMANFMDSRWRFIYEHYLNYSVQDMKSHHRHDMCVQLLGNKMKEAVAYVYVKNYFNEALKGPAQEVVDDMLKQTLKSFDATGWMDKETKEKAKEKIHGMRKMIAYPKELLDEQRLSKFHDRLVISQRDFFANILNLEIWIANNSLSLLRKPNDKRDWKKFAQVADTRVYYHVTANTVVLPAGALQGVFFDIDRPHYMNYGAIGHIVAHEIIHGFDDLGRLYDKDGNKKNWWDAAEVSKFERKTKCIVNQYNDYTEPQSKFKVDGKRTLRENIGDNEGIKQAFDAYLEWTKKNGTERWLPGLDYTPLQLFWVSAANLWCEKAKTDELENQIATSYYAPVRFRVIGPFSNVKAFSKTFKCPAGSKMNPAKKCSIWG